MLIATFLTTIFYSATYPYIHKEIIVAVSSEIVALSQIVNCIGVIVCGWLWNRWSKQLFRFYPTYCVLETALSVCSTVFAIATSNVLAYYIIDTLIFAAVTRNIICGGIRLRALRYNTEEDRERFDNNNNSASSLATIIGSAIAMLLEFDFTTMLCIATIGNAIDNAFYLAIYQKTIKTQK